MLEAQYIANTAGKKYSIKLWNLYFKNGGQEYCDAYLNEIDGHWGILLNGNGERILMSKSQIEYLISKMETLDLLKEVRKKLEHDFGLEAGQGIKKDNKMYKIMFQYQSHYKGDKQKYPFKFFIKSFNNNFRVDFDKMLLDLHKFKEILENVQSKTGMIKVESIYDIEQNKEIYHREPYDNGNKKNKKQKQKKNNSKSTCKECGTEIPDYVADFSRRNYDREMCRECQPN